MIRRFLRRFEKLENAPEDKVTGDGLITSKRFQRLEIGDNKVEVAITDRVLQDEKAPADVTYYFLCPYCGRENPAQEQNCVLCKRPLHTKLGQDYQEKARLLKKCVCGAMNQKERRNCWVCGRDFSLWGDKDAVESSDNIITLNIDGQIYKSSDKDLPPGIVALMERIRREGYKPEIVDEWLKKRNEEVEAKNQSRNERLSQIRYDLAWRAIGLVIFIIFMLFQFSMCLRFAQH